MTGVADVMAKSRLLQVFLSPNLNGPISYVHLCEDGVLVCTCAIYRLKKGCKHTRWVQAKLDEGGDYYRVLVPPEIAEVVAERPLTPGEFHHLVLHYGKVEVI